jgi:nucleoside diphosphate kinase
MKNQIKPDGVQRGIVGNIISRFETKGYKLVAMKTKQATKELLEEHYKDLVEKVRCSRFIFCCYDDALRLGYL